ncbi:MAG: SPFH domain-containing protein [Patescibacteria group bacterium]
MKTTIIISLLVIGIWYLAQLVIYLYAKLGWFWVVVKEGESVAIMRNKAFHKMKLRYTGHHFRGDLEGKKEDIDNLEIYNIEVSPNKEALSAYSAKAHFFSVVFPIKGILWVGVPPFYEVHRYTFKWTDDHLKERVEDINWILVQKYVYGITLDKIELEGGIPYNIELLVTMQITNPAKALFRVKRWFDASIERISGWARDEFSSLSLDDFYAPTSGELHAGKKLELALKKILGFTKAELIPQFGVSVDIVQVVKIDPSNENLRDVTIKREVAKQEALAVVEKANGEAAAIRIVNKAAEEMSDKAIVLKGFDAIRHAGANVTLVGKDLDLSRMIINIPTATANKKGGAE